MHAALAAWLLATMINLVPFEQHDHYAPREATEEHYRAFADDVATFALDPDVKPLFDGDDGRAKTALWLVVVPAGESHYNPIIASGGSVRPGDNDKGEAVGPWQTHWRKNPYGWTRDEIANDRSKQMQLAIFRMRESINACRRRPMSTWMTGYATGKFDCRENKKGAFHVWRAQRAWKREPFSPMVPPGEM